MPTVSGINNRRDTLNEAVDKSLGNTRLVSSKQINLVDNTSNAQQNEVQEQAVKSQQQTQPEPQQQSRPQDLRFTHQEQMNRGDHDVTASSVLSRLTEEPKQTNEDSGLRTLVAPQQESSAPQQISGYDNPDNRDVNMYDIQATVPPIKSAPDLGQLRKAGSGMSNTPTLESSVDMALGVSSIGLPAPQPSAQQEPKPEPEEEKPVDDGNDDLFGDNIVEDEPAKVTPHATRYIEVPSNKFYQMQKLNKDQAAASVANKHWSGHGFTGKVTSNESVFPDAVAAGIDEIIEIIRNPGNNFLNILREVTGLDITPEQALTDEGKTSIMEAVNSAARTTSPIWVVATKSPDPDHYSSQSRRLMIQTERGVTVHPTQDKVYTMDFDGDDVTIQFSANVDMFSNPMELMIGLDGKAMINEKLFPLPRIAESLDEYMKKIEPYILESYSNVINKKKIVEALYYATYREKIKNNRDPLVDLVMALDKEASKYSDHNLAMASMLNNIFGFMTYLKRDKLEADNSSVLPIYSSGAVRSPADGWVAMVIDEVAAGRVPMNVYDFQAGYNKRLAEAEGQNVPFRHNQDLMKILKTSKNTFVGDKEIAELYQLAVDAGYAMWLNGVMELGGKAVNYNEKIKEYVLARTGMPSKYKTKKGIDVTKWLRSFRASYNHIVGMMDAADVTVDMGLDISRERGSHQIESNSLLDFVTPIIKVYGDKVFDDFVAGDIKYGKPEHGKHMGDGKILPRYKNKTIERFSQNNGLKTRYELLSKKTISNCYMSDVIYALADHRRSQAAKFNKDYQSMLDQHARAFKYIEKKHADRTANWSSYISDITTLIQMSGPDMFQYYGMDDLSKFLNTEYGYKLRDAAQRSVDEMGGVHYSMIFNYRMRTITKLNGEISRLIYNEKIPNIARLQVLRTRLSNEIDVLASSSDLWAVIGKELRGDTSAYSKLLETRGKVLGKWTDARNVYWKHPNLNHNKLIDVLVDTDIPLSVKRKVATDVIRYSTHNNDAVKEYEIDYQLQIGPKPEHTSISTMTYVDTPSILDAVQKSTNRIKSFFNKNTVDYLKMIKTARAMVEPGVLTMAIKRMAEDPMDYLEVNDYMFVDAVISGMSPTTKSDEKGKNEDQVKVFYKTMKMQRGGFDNIMYRMDDSILGRVGYGDVSRLDLFKVLSDPEFSLEWYNGSEVGLLDKQTLCGGMSEDDVWNFLEANPRLANLFMKHIATSTGNDTLVSTTGTFLEALAPTDSVTSLKNNVKSFLFDDSMFASVVSLFVPKVEKNQTMIREKTKNVTNALVSLIIGLAKVELVDKRPLNVEDDVLVPLGVTVDKLTELGMEENTAIQYYEDLIFYMRKFISKTENIIYDNGYEHAARRVKADNVALEMDSSSVRSALDVMQFMVSGKISVSTEIEGGITARNQSAALYFATTKDKYMIIDELMTPDELAPLVGCMTNGGVFTGDNLSELVENTGSDPVVVEVPEEYEVQDGFVTSSGRRVSSVEVFCLHKRSNEAEAGNLQLKKTGRQHRDPSVKPQDDTTSSITRTGRYIHDWKKNRALIDTAFDDGGIFAARIAYAKILQKADTMAGYDMMDLANYMCIASEIIRPVENELGQSYKIVTLSQIADAVRKEMPPEIAFSGNTKDILAETVSIIDDISGMVIDDTIDPNYAVAPFLEMPMTPNGQFKPAKKAAMSFKDKNYKMQLKVSNSEKLIIPWTGEEVSKKKISPATETWMKAKHNKLAGQSVYYIDSSRNTEYRIIGRVGGGYRDIEYPSPGLQSVILIEPGATQADIDDVLKLAYGHGITVAFRDIDLLGDKADIFGEDAVPAPFSQELIMLPFFEMRMEGWSMTPPMAPGTFQRDPGWLVTTVESKENFYNVGDGQYLADKHLGERLNIVDSGVEEISLEDMFYNTNAMYPDDIVGYEFPTFEEVEATIINWRDEGPVIDSGKPESNQYEKAWWDKFPLLLQEYRDAFYSSADENGMLEFCEPDRIQGWVKCFVKGYSHPVWAPIIMFPTGSKLSVPVKYRINGKVTKNEATLSVPWELSESPYGHYVKMTDANGASGKGGAVINDDVDLGSLETGKKIDFNVARFSFDGRIEPGERRKRTLKTLTYLMSDPPYGYNFAELDSAFPDNPEIKVELLNGRISKEKWRSLYKIIGRFHEDEEIDAMLKKVVGKAVETGTTNPSDILATVYNGKYSFMEWDMNFYFEDSNAFENAWLKFMNSMNKVCPPNIDSFDETKHVFMPINDIHDPDYGTLLMRVPYPGENGTFWMWEVVYVSLSKFTNDSTPLHKVGLNISERTMEQISAAVMAGKVPSGRDLINYMRSTLRMSPQAALQPGTIEVDFSRYSRNRRD